MRIPDNKYLKILTWFVRFLVGGLFIFSGFVKGVDPWGTIYKVNDYLNAMNISVLYSLVVSGVFLLCAYEFMTGIFLVFGSFRKSSPVMAALLMAFMLPLTLWIAIKNPVADCGCFGDAFILSNWATFWKNVLLSLAIVWLLIYNKRCGWLIRPALQYIEFCAAALYIVHIGLAGYLAQPLIDFRNYKIGDPIVELNDIDSDDSEFVFIYEKNGVKKEFKESDQLPDESEGWVFVDRIDKSTHNNAAKGEKTSSKISKERNFRIWSEDGEEDLTAEIISPDESELFVLIPDMDKVSIATSWIINSLYEWSLKNNINFITVIAGSDDGLARWYDLAMPAYPIYKSEDTTIKEIARGNPALVYVVNNKIIWKNSLRALRIDDFMQDDVSANPESFAVDNEKILFQMTGIFAAILAVLIALSFSTKFGLNYIKRHKKSIIHDDKVLHEE